MVGSCGKRKTTDGSLLASCPMVVNLEVRAEGFGEKEVSQICDYLFKLLEFQEFVEAFDFLKFLEFLNIDTV